MYLQPRKAIYILFNTIVCTWPHLKLDYEKSFDTIGHLFFFFFSIGYHFASNIRSFITMYHIRDIIY